MPQRVILDGLWCGQGMANMIRVFKDSRVDPKTTAPDWLCIFDFGSGGLSASKKVLGVTPPVAFMMEQLRLIQAAGRTPRIDLMLISHQDRDHWQLLGELNVKIVESGMTVEVGTILLAGLNWRLSSKTAVKKFVDRAGSHYWYAAQYSSYDDPAHPGPPIEIGDMKMTMLVTNVATNDSKEDIERNCSSAIALVRLGQLSFILPGDTTWETLAALKVIMDKWPSNPLPFVYSASVPHHGALRTMNRNTSVTAPNLTDLIWFTNYAKPTSIFASAGIKNSHSHPYRVVLETMGKFTTAEQFQKRPIVVFNGPDDKFEQIPDVSKNIYTTVLNLTSPAQTANWIFNITPTTHDTNIQLFEAGVPGILSAPVLSEMELAAQRATAQQSDVDMDFSADLLVQEDDFPYPRRIISGPVVPYFGGAPAAAAELAGPDPVEARRGPRIHAPLPSAGAPPAPPGRPPPRRVRAAGAG